MTRLAVISDVHGNYKALEAFLNYLKEHPADGILCLGDYVTDSPYPQRTMELLSRMREQYPCCMVRGNREEYLLENRRKSKNWKPSSASGALYYTDLQLTEKDMAFFEQLPGERETVWKNCAPICLCHGTPGDIRGNVTLEEGLREKALEAVPQRYLFGGHSHHQEIFRYRGKTYLNPGSLGLAIDGVGRRAQFAEVTARGMEWDVELKSIPYDVERFLADFQKSGIEEYGMVLSRAIQKTLVTGVNFFYRTILEAERRSRETGIPFSELPESVWQEIGGQYEIFVSGS